MSKNIVSEIGLFLVYLFTNIQVAKCTQVCFGIVFVVVLTSHRPRVIRPLLFLLLRKRAGKIVGQAGKTFSEFVIDVKVVLGYFSWSNLVSLFTAASNGQFKTEFSPKVMFLLIWFGAGRLV